MPETRTILKIFLASPGDLSDERRTMKSVVDEINGQFANDSGYHVELVGWEDTISGIGRPQAIINAELERCEFFVGLMWKRWGTPPDNAGHFTSGFEEEFRRSVDRRAKEGRPEISLFFKEIDRDLLQDPGEELKKVLAFRDQLVAEKIILYEKFSDLRDFETKIRRCVSKYVTRARAREASEFSGEREARPVSGGPAEINESTTPPTETPFSKEGQEFLRAFIAKTERSAGDGLPAASEVARFRLLATIISSPGNDQRPLGVHDANIIYTERREFELGYAELRGLLVCGLDHYRYENVPLWHWYTALGDPNGDLLSIYSFIGETERCVAALSAMRTVSEQLPSESPFDRTEYLRFWFSDHQANEVKVAGLGYLGDLGIPADLPVIRHELDRNDPRTTNAAIEAIIRINCRDSREKAIRSLYEFQPASVNQSLLEALFKNGNSLSTELLTEGLEHQNPAVRRLIAQMLRQRHKLLEETAERMTNDSDAMVRYEALRALLESGRTYSEADSKGILVKPTVNALAVGFGRSRASDSMGDACWKQFCELRLRALSDKELADVARTSTIFDQDAYFILADRHFLAYGQSLRESVDDQFKHYFDKSLRDLTERFGSQGNDLPQQARSLEDFLRKNFTRKGLDVICRKGGIEDLTRVRTAVKNGFVDYSDADGEFLRRFGEWEDIPLIISALRRSEVGGSLLTSVRDKARYRTAARVIYSLGSPRLYELLNIQAPGELLAYVIFEASDNVIRNLSDASIDGLLHSETPYLRKALALRCVRALPKRRVIKVLAKYLSGTVRRYYDVVHWLDMGASLPKHRAAAAAERVISREWA